MLLNLSVHTKQWEKKPETKAEKGSLAKGFVSTELDLEGLAEIINNCQTLAPALLKDNHRLSSNFISSQVIMLDYDNNQDVDSEISKLKNIGLNPNLSYYSFSHKEGSNRFRLVIVLDTPIEDPKLYKSIVTALINKVGSDGSCKDVSRMFYGGSGATVLEAQSNEWSKAKIMLTGLINLDVSQRTSKRNKQMVKNGTNMDIPLLYKACPKKGQKEQYKHFDFTNASAFSNVFDGFSTCSIELKYSQLFNLISNMQYVNGGRKWVSDKMEMRGTYKAEDFALLTDIPAYGYLPESIESFDASLVGRVTNVLALRSKMLAEVVQKFTVVKEDVNTVSNRFIDQFNKAKNSSKRISLCYAVAGLGKTEVIIKEDNVIIAVPNHKLKNELAGRMDSKGLDFVATPEAPKFDCKELTAKYKEATVYRRKRGSIGTLKGRF